MPKVALPLQQVQQRQQQPLPLAAHQMPQLLQLEQPQSAPLSVGSQTMDSNKLTDADAPGQSWAWNDGEGRHSPAADHAHRCLDRKSPVLKHTPRKKPNHETLFSLDHLDCLF